MKKIVIIAQIIMLINYPQSLITSAKSSAESWPIINRISRSTLPADLQVEAKNTKMSVLKPSDAQRDILYQNYPNGSVLFPKNNDLATKFNAMIQSIQKNKNVIEFFRKIQIKALNQLYAYIMKIYTNLNLINPGALEKDDVTTANLAIYVADEAHYATNQKKILMNHFLNIIQAQFSSSIISYLPTMPTDLAATFGQMFIQNDCGIDLTEFTKNQTDPTIIAEQTAALNFLKLYIDFYQTYTTYLYKIDETGVNQYSSLAQEIQTYLKSSTTNNPMNPSMFFYDAESMRSIRYIPFAASTLPKNSSSIPWAPIITDAATKNLIVNGHEIAYFKDSAGKKTQIQSQAQSLFLLTEVGHNLFEEELLAQPGWLNNQNGCIRILRGCLGDCSALIGMGILDETIEAILQKIATPPIKNSPVLQSAQKTSAVEKRK